jgi:hypothetical protein
MSTKFKVGDLVRRVKDTLEILRVITWEEYVEAFEFPNVYIQIDRIPVKSVTNGDVSWECPWDLELLEDIEPTPKEIRPGYFEGDLIERDDGSEGIVTTWKAYFEYLGLPNKEDQTIPYYIPVEVVGAPRIDVIRVSDIKKTIRNGKLVTTKITKLNCLKCTSCIESYDEVPACWYYSCAPQKVSSTHTKQQSNQLALLDHCSEFSKVGDPEPKPQIIECPMCHTKHTPIDPESVYCTICISYLELAKNHLKQTRSQKQIKQKIKLGQRKIRFQGKEKQKKNSAETSKTC